MPSLTLIQRFLYDDTLSPEDWEELKAIEKDYHRKPTPLIDLNCWPKMENSCSDTQSPTTKKATTKRVCKFCKNFFVVVNGSRKVYCDDYCKMLKKEQNRKKRGRK